MCYVVGVLLLVFVCVLWLYFFVLYIVLSVAELLFDCYCFVVDMLVCVVCVCCVCTSYVCILCLVCVLRCVIHLVLLFLACCLCWLYVVCELVFCILCLTCVCGVALLLRLCC